MKIYFCKTHKKYGYNKLPCSNKNKKPYCVFGVVPMIFNEKGQIKLFNNK